MSFGNPTYLAWLYGPAPQHELRAEVEKLCKVLDVSSSDVVDELCPSQTQQCTLGELSYWNHVIESCQFADEYGKGARLFFAAQTLASTVLSASALDQTKKYNPAVKVMMERGADGLFEIGVKQFTALSKVAIELTDWLINREFKDVALVESPLGNSLPVQVVSQIGRKQGLQIRTEVWNSPRNDRPRRGWNINAGAKEFAKQVGSADCVLYLDDAITGSRFIKLYDALCKAHETDRVFGYVMLFDDTINPASTDTTKGNLERLAKRCANQENGPNSGQFRFPRLPEFWIDAGPKVRWESPVIWGESDLIAGKRKINLVFTLLDHLLGMLADLSEPKSEFRQFLKLAWQQDTSGARYRVAPDLLRKTFEDLTERLRLDDLRYSMDQHARKKFPEDYLGTTKIMHKDQAELRWQWLRACFLREAFQRLDQQEASFLWRAIDHGFGASFDKKRPRRSRDHDYAPYTLPFNDAISAMNCRICSRIIDIALPG